MRRLLVVAALVAASLPIVTPSIAMDRRIEKLGRMPAMMLHSEDDLKLLTSEMIKGAEESGMGIELDACVKSPDRDHAGAVVPKPDGKCCAWLDGVEGPIYDQIRHAVRGAYKSSEFDFSPDGSRLAYTARKGKKWVMVVDGQEGPQFDGMREPYFSLDSKRVCYVAFQGKDSILMLDGKERGRYPGISTDFPSFRRGRLTRQLDSMYCPIVYGPNDHFAFAASKGQGKDGRQHSIIVVDGKSSAEYEDIRGAEFSPDGSHFAFIAEKSGKRFVVQDGRAGPKFDDLDRALVYSPDGKRLAYIATRYTSNGDAKCSVVVDGKPGPTFEDIVGGSIAFSRDSKDIAYVATRGGKYQIVVNGVAGKLYDQIGEGSASAPEIYGPDGKLYYSALSGDKYYMVINGVASSAYDELGDRLPVFSPDGRHQAYSARIGESWFVVLDGQKQANYASIDSDSLTITANNKLAYSAIRLGDGHSVGVVDGSELPDARGLVVSKDGAHTAWVHDGEDGMNTTSALCDGQVVGKFDSVLQMNFDSSGVLSFLATKYEIQPGGAVKYLYRVRVSLTAVAS